MPQSLNQISLDNCTIKSDTPIHFVIDWYGNKYAPVQLISVNKPFVLISKKEAEMGGRLQLLKLLNFF